MSFRVGIGDRPRLKLSKQNSLQETQGNFLCPWRVNPSVIILYWLLPE
ncbi:MAG: hypothetical protein AAGA67_11705 [Cyanobacteria bacterium P01_F01_bin.153]